jgi:peptide subunit release factor 1 (eRF1)
LILAGPEERTAAFLSTLPQEVQDLVAETIHLPAEASEAEVMERISSVEERIERKQEEQILIAARERGVHGLQNTLEALQEGRVYHLLVPWPLDREVRWCDACATAFVDASEEVCPSCGGPTRARPLTSVLLNLATDRGARIEFMSGENAESLREEFGGLAGLVRF